MRKRLILGSLAAIALLILIGLQPVVAEDSWADDANLAEVAKGPSDESVVSPMSVGGSFPGSGGESGAALAVSVVIELRVALDRDYNGPGDVTLVTVSALITIESESFEDRRPNRISGSIAAGGKHGASPSQPTEELVLVDPRLAEDPADDEAAQGRVESHDEEVRSVRVDELAMAAPLALHPPAEAGHRPEEPPPVDLPGQTGPFRRPP